MALVDMAFLLWLAVVQPIYGAISYRRLVKRINSGHSPGRISLYVQTLILEWTMLFFLTVIWLAYDRPVAELGFLTPNGIGFWIGVLIALAVCGYFVFAWYYVRQMDADKKEKNRQALGDLIHISPHTQKEYRYFCLVSVTAGIVEEIIYRGYLFWCFLPLMPTWMVVIATSIVFGLAHSYQGFQGMIKVFLVGLCAAVIFIISGSIWIPIIIHIAMDILQGGAIKDLIKENQTGEASAFSNH